MSAARGFTLTELLVVIIIVAILAAVALTALVGALGAGREAGTQALIAKLDRGLNDRLQSLQSRTISLLPVDQQLALDPGDASTTAARATVIAKKRLMKEEFPHWFTVVLDPGGNDQDGDGNIDVVEIVGDWDPLWVDYNEDGVAELVQSPATVSPVARNYREWILNVATRDGVDNDSDGQTDEPDERAYSLTQYLDNHTHRTAMAECLYLILTIGPGSSAVDPTTFPHRETEDTDGDGIPELIDGWGNPVRFYRWSLGYRSQTQRGYIPYNNSTDPLEQREDDPLDPNRLLLLKNWWWLYRDSTYFWMGNHFERARSFPPSLAQQGLSPVSVPLAPSAFHVVTDVAYFDLAFVGDRSKTWNALRDPATGQLAPYPAYGEYCWAWNASKPLIVSAGPDGRFGIWLPRVDSPTISDISGWPDFPLLRAFETSLRHTAVIMPTNYTQFNNWWQQMVNFAPHLKDEIEAHLDNMTNQGRPDTH